MLGEMGRRSPRLALGLTDLLPRCAAIKLARVVWAEIVIDSGGSALVLWRSRLFLVEVPGRRAALRRSSNARFGVGARFQSKPAQKSRQHRRALRFNQWR